MLVYLTGTGKREWTALDTVPSSLRTGLYRASADSAAQEAARHELVTTKRFKRTFQRGDGYADPSLTLADVTPFGRFLEYEKRGEFAGVPIFTGLTVILGLAEAGKTTLLRALELKDDNTVSISWGEPEPESTSTLVEFARDLNAVAVTQPGKIILIDSFKEVAHFEGAAMEKGLSRGMFWFITSLSSLLARAGVAAIASLNPQLSSDEAVDALGIAIRASCSAYWKAGRVRHMKGSFMASSRALGDRSQVKKQFDIPSELFDQAAEAEAEQSEIDDQRTIGEADERGGSFLPTMPRRLSPWDESNLGFANLGASSPVDEEDDK